LAKGRRCSARQSSWHIHCCVFVTVEIFAVTGAVLGRAQEYDPGLTYAWTNASAEMRQAGTFELFVYWDELRRGRAAPERADLDPVAIRNVLADTFMLEVDADRTYPFCLSGTRLSALFDAELKGRPFLSLWNQAQRPEVARLMQMVVDGACPIVAGAAAAPEGYDLTEFELLLLPLRYHGKTHARVLGRIAPAKRPSWLGLIPVETLDFLSMRVLDGRNLIPARGAARTTPANVGLSPSFSSFEQRRHLRIYIGNT
jgi:hypothetical protein